MHKHSLENIKGLKKAENSSRAPNLPLLCKVTVCTVFFAEAAHCALGRYVSPREGNTVPPLRVNTYHVMCPEQRGKVQGSS